TVLDKAADMLARDTYVHHTNVNTRLIAGFLNGLLNSIDGFIDVENDTFHHTFRLRLSHAKDFKLAEFILPANDDTYFCGSDIEADYDFFLFHDVVLFIVVVLMRLLWLLKNSVSW